MINFPCLRISVLGPLMVRPSRALLFNWVCGVNMHTRTHIQYNLYPNISTYIFAVLLLVKTKTTSFYVSFKVNMVGRSNLDSVSFFRIHQCLHLIDRHSTTRILIVAQSVERWNPGCHGLFARVSRSSIVWKWNAGYTWNHNRATARQIQIYESSRWDSVVCANNCWPLIFIARKIECSVVNV